MTQIPEDIKKQIDEYAFEYEIENPSSKYTFKDVLSGAEFGYSLASTQLSEAKKEIEFLNKNCDNLNELINDCGLEVGRLKGLIESLHTDAFGISPFKWLEYKKQHNL